MKPVPHLNEEDMVALLNQPDLKTAKGMMDRTIYELMYSCALIFDDIRQIKKSDFTVKHLTLNIQDHELPLTKTAVHFVSFYFDNIYHHFNRKSRPEAFLNPYTGSILSASSFNLSLKNYWTQAFQARPFIRDVFRRSIIVHLTSQRVDKHELKAFMRAGTMETVNRYINSAD